MNYPHFEVDNKKGQNRGDKHFYYTQSFTFSSKEWGICVSKKNGGFEGMQRAHGLKGLGKILKSLQKQYGHVEQTSQDTQSYDCED